MTSRGTGPCIIFRDGRDHERLLSQLALVLARWRWVCHGFCLLRTHYHLVVETPEPDLAAGMQRLNGLYAQSFNQRHGRVGALFQGRYHSVLIERDEHLMETLRYLALNPVRAGICSRPEEWRWSSYAVLLGRAPPPPFELSARFASLVGGKGLDGLREFVEATRRRH